jgi:hypothetical protein
LVISRRSSAAGSKKTAQSPQAWAVLGTPASTYFVLQV